MESLTIRSANLPRFGLVIIKYSFQISGGFLEWKAAIYLTLKEGSSLNMKLVYNKSHHYKSLYRCWWKSIPETGKLHVHSSERLKQKNKSCFLLTQTLRRTAFPSLCHMQNFLEIKTGFNCIGNAQRLCLPYNLKIGNRLQKVTCTTLRKSRFLFG